MRRVRGANGSAGRIRGSPSGPPSTWLFQADRWRPDFGAARDDMPTLADCYSCWVSPSSRRWHLGFAEATKYKAPASEVALLPRFCWGQYMENVDGPEFEIRGCGVYMNHYCDGLLELGRAHKVTTKRGERMQLLTRAKAEYLVHVERDEGLSGVRDQGPCGDDASGNQCATQSVRPKMRWHSVRRHCSRTEGATRRWNGFSDTGAWPRGGHVRRHTVKPSSSASWFGGLIVLDRF